MNLDNRYSSKQLKKELREIHEENDKVFNNIIVGLVLGLVFLVGLVKFGAIFRFGL